MQRSAAYLRSCRVPGCIYAFMCTRLSHIFHDLIRFAPINRRAPAGHDYATISLEIRGVSVTDRQHAMHLARIPRIVEISANISPRALAGCLPFPFYYEARLPCTTAVLSIKVGLETPPALAFTAVRSLSAEEVKQTEQPAFFVV